PYFLQALNGFVQESSNSLVHVALGIRREALRKLRRGKVRLRYGLHAGSFLSFFLFRCGIGNLLDALLKIQEAFHVLVIRGLVVFFLNAATRGDDLLGSLKS